MALADYHRSFLLLVCPLALLWKQTLFRARCSLSWSLHNEMHLRSAVFCLSVMCRPLSWLRCSFLCFLIVLDQLPKVAISCFHPISTIQQINHVESGENLNSQRSIYHLSRFNCPTSGSPFLISSTLENQPPVCYVCVRHMSARTMTSWSLPRNFFTWTSHSPLWRHFYFFFIMELCSGESDTATCHHTTMCAYAWPQCYWLPHWSRLDKIGTHSISSEGAQTPKQTMEMTVVQLEVRTIY